MSLSEIGQFRFALFPVRLTTVKEARAPLLTMAHPAEIERGLARNRAASLCRDAHEPTAHVPCAGDLRTPPIPPCALRIEAREGRVHFRASAVPLWRPAARSP